MEGQIKIVIRERRKIGLSKTITKEKREMRKTKRVTKVGQRVLGMLLLAALFIASPASISYAAEADSIEDNDEVEVLEAVLTEGIHSESGISPYTMLADCIITASCASDGMHIDISTGVVGTGSVLGVKDVKIQKKTWLGKWKTVAVCSGSESYNRGTMGISILYEHAEKGETYRISCIHYGDVNGYTEYENVTGEFVFTY